LLKKSAPFENGLEARFGAVSRYAKSVEESPKLKRKYILAVLAVVSAMFLPLAAVSQIAPDRPAKPEQSEPSYKWQAFAGYGYTSLNQVNQSENGLQGVDLSLTRNWGNHFGLTADGGYYAYTYDANNPGNPTVDLVLLGPVFHVKLIDRVELFAHLLLGGAHTGMNSAGYSAIPRVSFAGGAGGGMDYKLNPRVALRLSGDDIASSFFAPVLPAGADNACSTGSECSSHMRRNARAAFGVVYSF